MTLNEFSDVMIGDIRVIDVITNETIYEGRRLAKGMFNLSPIGRSDVIYAKPTTNEYVEIYIYNEEQEGGDR